MGKINWARVILGGLVAGLVINISGILRYFAFADQVNAAMRDLNRPPIGGQSIPVLILAGFLLGIATMWIYAAMRPRLGPGPKTAIVVGLTVWFLRYVLDGVVPYILGLFPSSLFLVLVLWGLFELPIASLAGAWLYKEE